MAENHGHYYSGLVYTPALGTVSQINHLFFIRIFLYSGFCFGTLTLAMFSVAIWKKREKNSLFLHFGLLCFGVALYLASLLLRNLGLSPRALHVIEDVSWLFALGQSLHLSALCIGIEKKRCYRKFLRPATLACYPLVACSILCIIPQFGEFIKYHGAFIDGYKIVIWVGLAILAGMGLSQFDKMENLFILGANTILGASLYIDVMDSNRFEPIYGFWQNEYAAILLVFLFGCFMIQRNKKLLRDSEELHKLSVQYHYATQSAIGMREGIYQVYAMKHDITKHITAMSALCENKEYIRLQQYLQSLKKAKDTLPVLLYSNHFLINAILSSYLGKLKKAGVKIDLNIVLPDELPIADYDLCALLSNLFSNATEAILMQPPTIPLFISVTMSVKNCLFTLCIVNTAVGDDEDRLFPTTKNDTTSHGFGLSIIKNIVEKYSGVVRFSRKHNKFTAMCALSLRDDLPL